LQLVTLFSLSLWETLDPVIVIAPPLRQAKVIVFSAMHIREIANFRIIDAITFSGIYIGTITDISTARQLDWEFLIKRFICNFKLIQRYLIE
jgi:hypothetical protein